MPLSNEREAEIREYAPRSHGLASKSAIEDLLAAYDEQRAEVERLTREVGVHERYIATLHAEVERRRAQVAAAWDNGYREGVQDGESGYVAGTDRRLRRTRNPHLATCEHTEHAIGSRGRVGRTFQGTSDPAGRWERCDGHEVHDA